MFILIALLIIAGVQWLLIRRIPWFPVRVLVQVPLLAVTVLGAMYFLTLEAIERDVQAEQVRRDSVIDSTTVSRGDLIVSISGTGSITPIRQVSLNFSLSSSPVSMINAQVGDRVVAGQLIASLDNTDLQQAVDDAQIALNLQRSNFTALTSAPRSEDLAAAEAAVAAAEAQVNSAFATGTSAEEREIALLQAEIARNQLWQIQINRDSIVDNPPEETFNGIPLSREAVVANQAAYESQSRQVESSVIQAEYGVDIADANAESTTGRYADPGVLASANAGLVQAQVSYNRLVNGASELELQQAAAELQVAELNLEQAELNLEQSQLIAPFDGVLAQMNLTIGELAPQAAAVLLIDDSRFYVELPIDETDIAQINIGQRVFFEVDALPDEELEGIVSSIAYAPLQSQEINLVAYNVRVDVIAADVPIRAGMTVTGNIVTLEQPDVLLVRNNFIRIERATGDAFVTVRHQDGGLEERLILLGERNDSHSEVLAGLEEGEELALLPRLETE